MIFDFIVLRNGIPVFIENFDPKLSLSVDKHKFTLISGFFSAISSFADSVDKLGQVEEVKMTDYFFTFKRINIEKAEVLFILSSDRDIPKNIRKIIIEESSSKFLSLFEKEMINNWGGKVEPFLKFKDVLSDILDKILKEDTYEERGNIISPPPMKLNPEENKELLDKTRLITKRFERYKTLRHYQQKYEIMSSPYVKQIKNQANELPWASPKAWTTITTSSTCNFNFPSAQNASNIEYNFRTASAPIQNNLSYRNSIIKPTINYSSFINPKMQSGGMFTKDSLNYTENHIHSSVYDIIPSKIAITAGEFRNKFKQNFWSKVLFVAIDGHKSVNELAKELDSKPIDILLACQNMVKSNLVQFKR
ncbi:MAG: hypothetical protein ACTSWX_12055 [Promethearchaeota archaeon]